MLNILKKCEKSKYRLGTTKEKVFDEYLKLIKSVLAGLPDCIKFHSYESLQSANSLEINMLNYTDSKLEESLYLIHHDLYEWAENFVKVTNAQTIATNRCSKLKSIFMWIILGLVICGFVPLVILSLKQWITHEEQRNDWIALAGIFDFVIGFIGFLIERISDHINSKIREGANEVIDKNISLDKIAGITSKGKWIIDNRGKVEGGDNSINYGGYKTKFYKTKLFFWKNGKQILEGINEEGR